MKARGVRAVWGPLLRCVGLSLALGLIVGCTHRYDPRSHELSSRLFLIPNKFPFDVGYYISPSDLQLELTRQVRAETFIVEPYKAIEDDFQAILARVFRGVRRVEQDPSRGFSAPGLPAVFIPKIRIAWNQEVTVWVTAKLYD